MGHHFFQKSSGEVNYAPTFESSTTYTHAHILDENIAKTHS